MTGSGDGPHDGGPMYSVQLVQLVNSFLQRDHSLFETAILSLIGNAVADDDADRQLDVFSAALFMVVGHQAVPGARDGMPLDPGYIDELDMLCRDRLGPFHREGRVQDMFEDLLGGARPSRPGSLDEEELLNGLICRAWLIAMMLNDLARETCDDTRHDRPRRDGTAMLDEHLLLAGELWRRWHQEGRIPNDWPPPAR